MLVSQNQEGGNPSSLSAAAKSKVLNTPELIKNHANLLQERMSTQNFNSSETTFFSPPFNSLLEKIGKNGLLTANNSLPSATGIGSPNSASNSIFTNHQPLSFEMIVSFSLQARNQYA